MQAGGDLGSEQPVYQPVPIDPFLAREGRRQNTDADMRGLARNGARVSGVQATLVDHLELLGIEPRGKRVANTVDGVCGRSQNLDLSSVNQLSIARQYKE